MENNLNGSHRLQFRSGEVKKTSPSGGYTGHEHLPWFKLINMNGRLYDPLTAQFLSADNYIQSPSYTQNFNRYTYCFNNPLKYSDPSGLVALMDPKLPGGDGGGGSDNGANNYRFYEPAFDNGLGSGQAWACRTITPHIAASKENRYYYIGNGKYQNCLGEIVSFEEVYANILAPMFDHVLVRQEAYISTHPGEKGELKAYRWVTKYEPIDYSKDDAAGQVGTQTEIRDTRTAIGRIVVALDEGGYHDPFNIGQSWEEGKKTMLSLISIIATGGTMAAYKGSIPFFVRIIGSANMINNADNILNLSSNIHNQDIRNVVQIYKFSVDAISVGTNIPPKSVIEAASLILDSKSTYDDFQWFFNK